MHARLAFNIYGAREPRYIDGGRGGGKVGVLPLVLCRARDALVACEERDRPALREINGVLGETRRRDPLPLASNRSFLRLLLELPPSRLARLGLAWLASTRLDSAWLGLAWLGSAWLGSVRLVKRWARSQRFGTRSERARIITSRNHTLVKQQRWPAQIMVGCVERRGGGCGDCRYEARGCRRSSAVAYARLASSLSLPSPSLSRFLSRSLARSLCPFRRRRCVKLPQTELYACRTRLLVFIRGAG